MGTTVKLGIAAVIVGAVTIFVVKVVVPKVAGRAA